MIANHRSTTDSEFLNQMDEGTINPKLFNHEAHICMAWLYLTVKGIDGGIVSISNAIRQLDQQYSSGTKYRHTITVAFSQIIALLIWKQHSCSWKEFVSLNKDLLKSDSLTGSILFK